MNRDRSIDLGKGLAILFVYLGHSVLYHPIQMVKMYPWCSLLDTVITSFNMPLFFLISGYLFSKTRKSTSELYKTKTLRILVPYLTTMAIIICMKLVLPVSMSYNSAVTGGFKSLLLNALLYGGDRWFVYTLYIMFLLLIPVRDYLKNRWLDAGLICALIVVFFMGFMPTVFALDKVFHFMVFFVVGYMLNEQYKQIKDFSLKYNWLIYAVFVVLNIVLIHWLRRSEFVFRFILPFTGSLAMMTVAFELEKKAGKNRVVQYIEYCGKYSLQFYLFTFCYPIIRTVIVNYLHISNPFVILISVFVLQLVTITIIVEVTRHIKWLRIPCGYID